MNKQGACTALQAAALYDLHCRGAVGDGGLTLVVDLDSAGCCICRREADGTVTPVWERTGSPLPPFFRTLAQELMPEEPDPTALAGSLLAAAPSWTRGLRSHVRNPQPGMVLPLATLGIPSISVGRVTALFSRHWEAPIRQALAEARTFLSDQAPRIVPIGTLAQLFTAEYLIRCQFYPGTGALLPVLPGLARCAPGEDPARFIPEGHKIWQELTAKAHTLSATVMLQVRRRSPEGLVSELLTLAEQDTPHEQLRQARYTEAVYVDIREPLVIFFGSKMHRITLPGDTFGKGKPAALAKVGLGLQDDRPALMLGLDGTEIPVPLDLT